MSSKEKVKNKIFELKEKGLSYEKIAEKLNKAKISTISGKGKWHRMSVSRLYIEEVENQVKRVELELETIQNEVKKQKKEKRNLLKEVYLVKQNKEKKDKEELNKMENLKKEVKQVKQDNIEIKEELLKSHNLNIKLENELNKVKQDNKKILSKVKQSDKQLVEKSAKVKQKEKSRKINIDGWSVQKSGGYYRMFKKINGQVNGIYIGKILDKKVAQKKIKIFNKKRNFK